MIEIKLTDEQYENLIKLIYLGTWMIGGIRARDNLIEKYEDLAQCIYSNAKEDIREKYFEFDEETKRYIPKKEFEEDPELDEIIDDYNEEVFWNELIFRLAGRDLLRIYGEDAIRNMSIEERAEKEYPLLQMYEEEVIKNGIKNLEIRRTN
ncbi:hypothetical protein NLD30_11895 [SCandidatus Aminicenantes bacterium Aminicenantia_JdfR_composite]|nr:hypothetical protein [SCandidatus Aminicenantes bacterium Aminicenantia_JdfR_composite]